MAFPDKGDDVRDNFYKFPSRWAPGLRGQTSVGPTNQLNGFRHDENDLVLQCERCCLFQTIFIFFCNAFPSESCMFALLWRGENRGAWSTAALWFRTLPTVGLLVELNGCFCFLPCHSSASCLQNNVSWIRSVLARPLTMNIYLNVLVPVTF